MNYSNFAMDFQQIGFFGQQYWVIQHHLRSFIFKIGLFYLAFFRYKERMEVFLLDVEQSNLNSELSISVATKFLMPFEGRWGFAYAYYAKERLLFLHGGFSATHNYGQTVLFQVSSQIVLPWIIYNLLIIFFITYTASKKSFTSVWSKTTINNGGVGGAGVDPQI